jgi:hypothetical protein
VRMVIRWFPEMICEPLGATGVILIVGMDSMVDTGI